MGFQPQPARLRGNMRRLIKTILISLIISVVSFGFYLCPQPAILINDNAMNELLLAMFGAGISIVFTESMEYRYRRNELEDSLLSQSERLISSFAGIKEIALEPLGNASAAETCELLCAYFEERDEGSILSQLFSEQHKIRNKIIQIVEGCTESECEAYADNSSSCFNRLIKRVEDSIQQTYESYRFCFDNRYDKKNQVIETVSGINYFTELPCFSEPPRFSKKGRLLYEYKMLIEKDYTELDEVIKACRLFENGQTGYSPLLRAFFQSEKLWNRHCGTSGSLGFTRSENRYAIDLFNKMALFAKRTSSPLAHYYEGDPWWY